MGRWQKLFQYPLLIRLISLNDPIEKIEQYFNTDLPAAYRQFLQRSEDESYGDIIIYLVDDVIERNECYEIKEYTKGYINIGDDGGGQAFIILLSEADPAVYAVDHGSMNPDERTLIHPKFSAWYEAGFVITEDN